MTSWPTLATINHLLAGGMVLASVAIGLFFLRFWRKSRDRLFLLFAIAFWVYGADRLLLSLFPLEHEGRAWLYAIRSLAFLVILIAIVDKNRQGAAKR
jgi:uncharacterized membrane protein HdeD (DUF308 family)